MTGIWVIFVWALVSLIFLLKIPAIRSFLTTLRRMSVFGMICTVLCFCFFADVSYTKDGATTNQAVSQALAPFIQNSEDVVLSGTASVALETLPLPSWWNDDSTDADGDGIPDLWEKWTHGNRAVADSDIDRDDDGLTDLEEFQNQTDPRTADTDGDSFSDAFEVANGMNPVVSEDFTPDEPDLNHNGLPDIWEQAGYYSSFQDADHDGFDDSYEAFSLPAASDDNFDVLVDVYTTRSAELTWESEGEWGSLLILPTVGTSVKLRLPFGVDTELKLLPAPYATDPPPGELWKSRMRLSFIPRTGQSNVGNALVSSSGGIAHKIVNLESMIVRFSNPLAASGFQTLSLTDAGAIGLNIEIKAGSFEVYCDDKYHGIGDNVGPFIVTNQVGMGACTYNWHSEYGTMYPDSGLESDLTVEQLPVFSTEKITVVTTAELDSETCIEVTTSVEKCYQQEFSARLSTDNFSPHLFETNWISVDVPGCEHIPPLGWLEIEVERETIGEMQHVAYVDLDGATPTLDRYLDTSELGGEKLSFAWDGIATEGAASADAPDVFTLGTGSFRRALLQVISGEPVPPPYYTVSVRLWNSGKSEVINECSETVYVPQVVKIEMTDEAYEEFKKEILYPGTFYPHLLGDPDAVGCESNIVLYAGCTDRTKAEVLAQIAALAQFLYHGNVNVRFTSGGVAGSYKTVHVQCDHSDDAPLGRAITRPVVFPSAVPFGTAYVNMNIVRMDSSEEKYYYENGPMSSTEAAACEVPSLFPFLPDNLAHAVASTVAHETGHLLGLVNKGYLGGTAKKHNWNTVINGWMMNAGGYTPSVYHLGSHSNRMRIWKPLNAQYLQFILPKGDL